MDKWRFDASHFNQGHRAYGQLGSIVTPDGYYLATVEGKCNPNGSDLELVERVINVLNRELPGGYPRSRRRKNG